MREHQEIEARQINDRGLKHEIFELMVERLEKADRASRRVWLALLIGLIPMAGLELLKVRLYKKGGKR